MKKFSNFRPAVILVCMILGITGCSILPYNMYDLKNESEKREEIQTEEWSEKETESENIDKNETEKVTEFFETETETESETEPETESEKETETEEKWNGHIVGIDPGHQGSWVDMSATEPDGPGSSNYKAKSTTGTMGRYTGVPEYELNLTISLALRDELEERGYQVVMTREDNDTAISNIERARKAADGGSEIYVRIHANGSDDTSVKGALGMVPSPQNPYVGYLAQDSYRLSECILNSYCNATGFANLGIQYYDNMTGINWSTIPVTILEMGFMTNESDDLAMQEKSMQEKMVQGIADGVDEYFGIDRTAVNENRNKQTDADGIVEDMADPISDIHEKYLSSRDDMGEKWSVSIENLKNHDIYSYNEEEKMQSASVIKVFIMGAVYDRMCYPSSPDRLISSAENYDGELRYLLEQMITVSSNEAANELITRLGEGDFSRGAQAVNQFCRENGYTSTSVGRRFMEENPTGDNYTSAQDCRKILEDIYEGNCVNQEASEKMMTILKQQTNLSKIPAGLPAGYATANKTGEMPEGYGLGCIENDMAIVFSDQGDYILVVLSNNLGGRNEEAKQVITQISKYVLELF